MSDNHWWFFDLALVIAVTGALTVSVSFGLEGTARIVLMIPLICFLPGYALVSVLFPDKPADNYQSFDEEKTGLGNPLLVTGGLETIERLILSVISSVALVPAIALLASATPRGLTVESVLPGIGLLTVGLALVAIGTRYRCPADRRFTPSVSSASVLFTEGQRSAYDRTNPRPYNIAIVVTLLLLVASGGYAVANPSQHDGFTEFEVETENVTGDTETMYKSTYTAGESHELQATITNQEHEEREYTTVVLLEQVDDNNDVQGRAELDRDSATVADGETHQQTFEITPSMQGDGLRLTLLLYAEEPPADPTTENAYRTIHLPIEVE